jgi:DmsE family decaheme c-type cytochrome
MAHGSLPLRIALAGFLFFGAVVFMAQEEEPVDRETCAVCHEETAEAFSKGPHGTGMAAMDPGLLDRSCETCHGSAAAHVEDPSPENIQRKPEESACLSCHAQARGLMELSTPGHVRNGVSCLDCHASGHEAPAAEPLLAGEPADMCGVCHRKERADFRLPYAHREGDDPVTCLSCHDLHGSGRVGRLTQLHNGGVCIDCHTEKAGPFVFPHPPREVDGCIACHEPHGSVNPRQLKRRRVADLCLECHAGIPAFHDITKVRYQSCQSCHAAVHGSNRDPRLFEE